MGDVTIELPTAISITSFLKEITGEEYELVESSFIAWGYVPLENGEESTEQPTDFDSPKGYKVNTNFPKGDYYQIMPRIPNDPFYYWYSLTRKAYQTHFTKEEAIVNFIKFWVEWKLKGKPRL